MEGKGEGCEKRPLLRCCWLGCVALLGCAAATHHTYLLLFKQLRPLLKQLLELWPRVIQILELRVCMNELVEVVAC